MSASLNGLNLRPHTPPHARKFKKSLPDHQPHHIDTAPSAQTFLNSPTKSSTGISSHCLLFHHLDLPLCRRHGFGPRRRGLPHLRRPRHGRRAALPRRLLDRAASPHSQRRALVLLGLLLLLSHLGQVVRVRLRAARPARRPPPRARRRRLPPPHRPEGTGEGDQEAVPGRGFEEAEGRVDPVQRRRGRGRRREREGQHGGQRGERHHGRRVRRVHGYVWEMPLASSGDLWSPESDEASGHNHGVALAAKSGAGHRDDHSRRRRQQRPNQQGAALAAEAEERLASFRYWWPRRSVCVQGCRLTW